MKTLALVVVLAACGKSEQKTEAKTVDNATATHTSDNVQPIAGFEKLMVIKDGKPVKMTRAFIKRVSPDQWRLFVGDTEGSCEELLSGVTNSQKGATHFVTTLRRQLAPDGTTTIRITDLWTAGHPTKATFSTARITEPTDKGEKVEIELQKITDDDGGTTMTAEGSLIALGCGDQPPDGAGVPNDTHVSAASMTVAGKRLEIKSATLEGDDLTLSTGPKDCSPVTPWSQVVLQRRLGRWTLRGTWFENESVSTDEAVKDLKVSTGAQGSGKDGPTMAITLAGSGTIGGYPITLDGTIEAIDCPTTK